MNVTNLNGSTNNNLTATNPVSTSVDGTLANDHDLAVGNPDGTNPDDNRSTGDDPDSDNDCDDTDGNAGVNVDSIN